jgi:hypothetical protein
LGFALKIAGVPKAERRERVRAAAELLDPDGAHDPASDLTRNRLHLSPTDGLLLLRGELVGDHALIAREAIEAKTDELFRQYSREREQFPDATIPPRSTLRALALVELLRRAQGVDPDSSTGPRTDASIVIHADHAPEDPANPPETALAAAGQGTGPVVTTRDGQRLSKSTSAVLVCAALFQVLITSVTGTGVPLAETDGYQPNRAMRRQLRHRDGGCTFPGCAAKPEWCDVSLPRNDGHLGLEIQPLTEESPFHGGVPTRVQGSDRRAVSRWRADLRRHRQRVRPVTHVGGELGEGRPGRRGSRFRDDLC